MIKCRTLLMRNVLLILSFKIGVVTLLRGSLNLDIYGILFNVKCQLIIIFRGLKYFLSVLYL